MIRLVHIERQSVVSMNVDAIVNAANCSLLGGGGVDGAIHKACGPRLLEECKSLHGCKTGQAKKTAAYDLTNAKYIIHTVGPIYRGRKEDAELLKACYWNSLELAKSLGCKSIAFPCISTGVYGYPLKDACCIAYRMVMEWNKDNDMEIYLCCYREIEYQIMKETEESYYGRI